MPEVGLGLLTPNRIAQDFMELEAAFNEAVSDPNGHFVSEADITLKEVDDTLRTRPLEMVMDNLNP